MNDKLPVRITIFSKIVILICLLLFPVVLLFFNYNQRSMDVMQKEIEKTNFNRLSFFLNQLEMNMEQFAKMAITLRYDPDAIKFQGANFKDVWFDVISSKRTFKEKIILQSNANSWSNMITVFSPLTNDGISTNPNQPLNISYFQQYYNSRWTYRTMQTETGDETFFAISTAEPQYFGENLEKSNLIVEVSVSTANIVRLLDQLKAGSYGDPFFYNPNYDLIVNKSTSKEHVRGILTSIKDRKLEASGNQIVDMGGQKFLFTYVESPSLGWYLIDYIPLEAVFQPVEASRNRFYIIVAGLLLLSIMATLMLYRNVQMPIKQLIRATRKLRMGEYTFRIQTHTNNEFDFLNNEFNAMSRQIQELIERVYNEQLRSNEAQLKQLQSQINPHFLYNCFAIIHSMAHLDNRKAIMAMTQNLSSYYRYSTRVDTSLVEARIELAMVGQYLEILKMKISHLDYHIHIPKAMEGLEIPKLLIQPLVENAVIHGVEKSIQAGLIKITGLVEEEDRLIHIEDNGTEITMETIRKLNALISGGLGEDTGCGIWNVHQRLKYQFGSGSGLQFAQSTLGGLCVTIKWKRQ